MCECTLLRIFWISLDLFGISMDFLGIRLRIETILILWDNYQIIVDQHNFWCFLEIWNNSDIYIFTKHFIWNIFKECPSSRASQKNIKKLLGFTHPFKFGIASIFNLITAVFITEIGHFSGRTATVFNSVNGDFSKTILTCLDIFHFSFQDFLSKSYLNFEVIIEIKFDFVCEYFSDCSWMLIEKNYRVSRAKFKSKINFYYKN